jgi:putative peptidoglycan lipid II flippase
MRRIFGITLRNLLFLTLPAAVGLIILREPIIRLLLQRGEFTAQSTHLTAWALGFFALGLVGHAVVEIATRAFYALKNTKTPVAIAVAAMLLNIGLSVWLMRIFPGWGWPAHAGLALAISVAVTAEMGVLLLLLRPQMGGLGETRVWVSLGKIVLATGGMGLVLLLVMFLLSAQTSWLRDLIAINVGGATYFGLAYLLGLDEMLVVLKRVTRRVGRGRAR